MATSSCGLCGKSTLDQVEARCDPVAPGPLVAGSVIVELPRTLRASQTAFDRTGGLHAAGLFDADGRLLMIREDVGRHNAFDKLIGAVIAGAGDPARGAALLTCRCSTDIVQKATAAGIPVLIAISTPTSAAVRMAAQSGLTLIGLARHAGFEIFTHPERIIREDKADVA